MGLNPAAVFQPESLGEFAELDGLDLHECDDALQVIGPPKSLNFQAHSLSGRGTLLGGSIIPRISGNGIKGLETLFRRLSHFVEQIWFDGGLDSLAAIGGGAGHPLLGPPRPDCQSRSSFSAGMPWRAHLTSVRGAHFVNGHSLPAEQYVVELGSLLPGGFSMHEATIRHLVPRERLVAVHEFLFPRAILTALDSARLCRKRQTPDRHLFAAARRVADRAAAASDIVSFREWLLGRRTVSDVEELDRAFSKAIRESDSRPGSALSLPCEPMRLVRVVAQSWVRRRHEQAVEQERLRALYPA